MFQIRTGEEFPHLTNAPITEAVIEFRTRARAALDERALLAGLEERLPDYPRRESMRQMEASVRLGTAPEAHVNDLGSPGVWATADDGRQIAKFQLDRFALSRLAPYESWESFQAEALRLWDIHVALATPAEIQRVGVRFINQLPIPMPMSEADLKGIFHNPPRPPRELEELPISGFLYQENLEIPGHPYRIRIIRTVQPRMLENPEGARLILDVDVSTTDPLPVTADLLREKLREMRWLKNKAFFGCVSNTVIQSPQGER